MKSFVVLCVLATAVVTISAGSTKGGRYTDRYDNINLDEILSNRRLLIPYIKCALGQARCTPDGMELKSHIKEALETHCAKCTEAQQKGARRVIAHMINHEPAYWQQLAAKYDPQNKFTKQYEQELRGIAH